jgi:hypothetical protein
MITKLTDKQQSKFEEYVNKWVKIGIDCGECNMKAAIKAAKLIYATAKLPAPEWFLGPFNNPVESMVALEALEKCDGRKFKNNKELNEVITQMVKDELKSKKKVSSNRLFYHSFGSQEFWLSFYDFFENECKLKCCKKLEGFKQLSKVCGWWMPLQKGCIFQHRPEKISFDAERRCHSLDGPAIKFRGEEVCNVYAVHGVRVPKHVVEQKFTAADIDKETNAEVRRVMIELFGQAKYLLETNAEIVNIDDWGTLYKKPVSDDETICMVKVLNATPEKDGSFKDYFIRVDPNQYGGLKTARAAIASTWRNKDGSLVFKTPEEYDPDVET